MNTVTIQTYKFNELAEHAKEKARSWWRDGGLDYEWYDFIYEDVRKVGKCMGIEINKIYFSGFWSQGDGACFEGLYTYEKNGLQKLKEYCPKDEALHRIAKVLQGAQKKHFYRLSANVKHRGHYYHERCTDIDVYLNGEYLSTQAQKDAAEDITEALRDFMRWIYEALENEYEYLMSDEAVDESIICNEYDFTEDGKRF